MDACTLHAALQSTQERNCSSAARPSATGKPGSNTPSLASRKCGASQQSRHRPACKCRSQPKKSIPLLLEVCCNSLLLAQTQTVFFPTTAASQCPKPRCNQVMIHRFQFQDSSASPPQAYVGTVDVRHILVTIRGMGYPQDKLIFADPAILHTVPLSSASESGNVHRCIKCDAGRPLHQFCRTTVQQLRSNRTPSQLHAKLPKLCCTVHIERTCAKTPKPVLQDGRKFAALRARVSGTKLCMALLQEFL